MVSKTVLFFCGLVFLFQITFGQVLPAYSGNSFVENNVVVSSGSGVGVNNGLGNIAINNGLGSIGINSGIGAASNLANAALASGLGALSTGQGYVNLASISGGGVLPVTSYSPIAPGGLTVLSDNSIEGPLLVSGQLPFLSAVAFEGALNTDGAGAASCGCGTGSIGITSENYGSSLNGLGYGLGGIGGGLGARGLSGLRL